MDNQTTRQAGVGAAGTVPTHCSPAPGSALSSEHRRKIRSSALADGLIDRLGWRSLPDGRLEIPYRKPDGSAETQHDGSPWVRWRMPEAWRQRKEAAGEKKPPKYLSAKDAGCRLYHSALALAAGNYAERLADRFTPLRITEGELKTEAANAHDPERLTIGLGGVSSWKDKRAGGEVSQPLPELLAIPMKGREVRLCFDSDLRKPSVAAALQELAEFLEEHRGARVLIEVLPHGLDGERLGLDDLIYRHGPAAFQRIAAIAKRAFKVRQSKDGPLYEWIFDPNPRTTHERLAYLVALIGRQWRRGDDGKESWLQWTGTHWEDVTGEDRLTAQIEAVCSLQGWEAWSLSDMRSAVAAFRRSIAAASDHHRRGLLPFRNGVLSLDELVFSAHAPENGNRWALPYDYNPAAACPGIEALLLDRLEDPASVAVFRAFGRILLTGERVKAFLEITGPGDTGKSALANLLIALVGKENTAACTLQRIEDRGQRFETLKLRGRRLAMFSECQSYSGPLEILKAITGGDPIGAEVKGGRHLDFLFEGGVCLVGNGPIRASDPTGAVMNRRRSLPVSKVVATADQRPLIEPDGAGGWAGELAGELPGFVNWCLAMPAAEARAALARDVGSLHRAEAELDALLATDYLAEWADQSLIWEPGSTVRVGTAQDSADCFAFASYLRFIERQGGNARPYAMRSFKSKLVDLLRDTLGLPMPKGGTNAGEYRERGRGSVIPCLRFRSGDGEDEAPGVIRHGFMARANRQQQPTQAERMETPAERQTAEAERIGNGKTPVGNGWNGWNGSDQLRVMGKEAQPTPAAAEASIGVALSPDGGEFGFTVPSVPSVPQKGSHRSASVPEAPRSVPRSVPEAPSAPARSVPLHPLPPEPVLNRLIELQHQFPTEPPAALVNRLPHDCAPGLNGAKVRAWLDWADRFEEEHASLPALQLRDPGEAAA